MRLTVLAIASRSSRAAGAIALQFLDHVDALLQNRFLLLVVLDLLLQPVQAILFGRLSLDMGRDFRIFPIEKQEVAMEERRR